MSFHTWRHLVVPQGGWEAQSARALHMSGDEQKTLAALKRHPLHVFPSELVTFQVSLPWQQLCSWRSAARPHKSPLEQHSLEFSPRFPGPGRRHPFVCCLLLCSLDAPLNVSFCLFSFFPLLKGELAQTFLGVLTGFNEQLMSRSRTSTNQTVLCTGVEGGVAGYPSVPRLWLLISSSLCSKSAQKSNYFDF